MASEPALSHSPFRSTRTNAGEREEKRDALLLAAVRMFNERGFHATSLDDVAATLGVTKPVIYHHLGNKEQVLFECVRRGIEKLHRAADQARTEPGTGLDRLRSFLRLYAQVIMGEFGRCVIRTGEELLSPDARLKFRALKREIDDAMQSMIVLAAEDGSARIADARLTGLAFAGSLNWLARWYRVDGPLPPSEMAAQLVDILCAGIEPRQ